MNGPTAWGWSALVLSAGYAAAGVVALSEQLSSLFGWVAVACAVSVGRNARHLFQMGAQQTREATPEPASPPRWSGPLDDPTVALTVIAALVHRLGGAVELTPEDYAAVANTTLCAGVRHGGNLALMVAPAPTTPQKKDDHDAT